MRASPISPERVHPGRRGIGADRPARPLGARHRDARRCADWDRTDRHAAAAQRSASISRRSRSAATTSPRRSSGALAGHGIAGDRLTLELTESAIIQDPERVAKALERAASARRHASRWTISAPATPRWPRCSAADRRPQDRPQLRHRHARRRRFDRDRPRHPVARQRARHGDDRRGDRDRRSSREALAELGCTYGQGFHYRRAAAGRRSARLLARAQRLIDMAPGDRADCRLVRREAGRAPIRARSPAGSRDHRARPPGPSRSARRRRPAAAAAASLRAPAVGARLAVAEQDAVDRLLGCRSDRRAARAHRAPASRAAEASRLRGALRQAQPRARPRRRPPDRPGAGRRAGGSAAGAIAGLRLAPRPARASRSTPSARSRAAPASRCRARSSARTVGAGSGKAEQLQQLVGDPLARQRHQIVGARRAGVERRRRRARRRRSGRGSGRSAGCADGPRRCGSADRR